MKLVFVPSNIVLLSLTFLIKSSKSGLIDQELISDWKLSNEFRGSGEGNITLDRGPKVQSYIMLDQYSEYLTREVTIEKGLDVNKYKISMVLLSMTCNSSSNDGSIRITSSTNAAHQELQDWCSTVDNNGEYIRSEYIIDGESSYLIEMNGDWSNIQAAILATIYYDVDNCEGCSGGSFCCESDKCNNDFRPRCISKNLKCNGFPNCGMVCNADEDTDEACCVTYFGYPCEFNYWNLMWMTSIAITFFILVPAVVAFLFCYNRELSRSRLLRPHPDPSINIANRRRAQDIVTVHSPPDDLPPTYDAVHSTSEPPPCFCAAVKPNLNDNVSKENPAFVHELEDGEKCSCEKSSKC